METPIEHTGSENVWTDKLACGDSGAVFSRRFWEKVERRGEDDCWPWTGNRITKTGRGQVHIRWDGGKNVRKYAPVVSWELANGLTVPVGCVVAHSCDNPNCVNPNHLRAVPQAENIRDSVRKGRYNAFGIQKLNAAQVLTIRARGANGEPQRTIAAAFGIVRTTVSQILNHRTWAHLEGTHVVTQSTGNLQNVEPVSASESADILGQFRRPSRQRHQSFQSVHTAQSAVRPSSSQFKPLEGGR